MLQVVNVFFKLEIIKDPQKIPSNKQFLLENYLQLINKNIVYTYYI